MDLLTKFNLHALVFVLIGLRVCVLTNSSAQQQQPSTALVENVIGVAGGKVSLPCDITPPTPDDAVSLILWYKDESTTPIYSLDARKGKLDQARHASNDILNSRSYMNIDRKPATFSLEQLQEDDAGEYRCRVDFKKERTRNFVVYLKILVPPEKPIISDVKSGEPLTSLIGPFNEGDKLTLNCQVSGGKPRPSLTWWRESVLLDDSYETLTTSPSSGLIRNTLEIPALQRHDLMAVLTCQASNNNISSPQVSSVTVDLNFRPLLVKIQGDNKAFSSGKPGEVTCQTAGSRPAPTITWWLGTTRLKKTREKHSADGNITTSILTFKPSPDDTGKHLFCRAENPLIPASALEDSWKLTIHYVPQLTLRLGNKLRHSHIQAGNDVYFECIIRSNPRVTEIRWWFEGKELHTNTSAGIIVSNQSLVLQKVQRAHRGRYTCTALNSEGEGESKAVHLRVQFAPVCKERQKALYGAARMEAVKIKCELEADPPEVSFTWSFNNSNENFELTNHVSDGASSIVTYVPKTEHDYGTLFCWGKNSVDSQLEPCIFTVIPAGPPDPLKNCSLTNSSEDSLRVDCTEGYDGGLMQHFILEVYDSYFPVDLKANISSNWPSFTVKGLPPGTTFTLKMYSVNSKGSSLPETLIASTLAQPESANQSAGKLGQVWQLTASPFLLILITIVTIIVVLALLIIMILKICPSSPRIRKNQDHISGNDEKESKLGTPLRKPIGDEVYDVCTCNDADDKCPDIIPDITGLTGSEVLTRNGDLKDETINEKLDHNNPLTTPLLSNSNSNSTCQPSYNNSINCHHLMETTGHQLNHWRSTACNPNTVGGGGGGGSAGGGPVSPTTTSQANNLTNHHHHNSGSTPVDNNGQSLSMKAIIINNNHNNANNNNANNNLNNNINCNINNSNNNNNINGQSNYSGPITPNNNPIHLTDYNNSTSSSSAMKVPFITNHPYLHHQPQHPQHPQHLVSQSSINRLQSMTSDHHSPSLFHSQHLNHPSHHHHPQPSSSNAAPGGGTVTILTSTSTAAAAAVAAASSNQQPLNALTSSSSSLSSITAASSTAAALNITSSNSNSSITAPTTQHHQQRHQGSSSYYLNNLTLQGSSGSILANLNGHSDIYQANNLSHQQSQCNNNASQQQPQHFATLSYPRRVRVLPSNTFTIRSTDDIDSHHHTDV